ncbi:uncharacterized protein LOC110724726 [Chenopodium quinoa]|uniref:uncharacterized protein LOC110724726 n=1 Tax=Chenopodium quinoa TaxID=63459 RepID=UPI000B772E77|nr:uncharacterized protein LOC110724726 [Chenopodium quinoa]
MGALALPSPWIPEDDLRLKNAIEAGASLESLAKGAVQFSRRFTIKELQDRWLALLYDPIISTRAAEQMVELERSSSNLASKSNRADNTKGAKNAHGKRRAESVRRCYYAMRKRICNEPHNQGDLAFLVGTSDSCFMNGAEAPVPDDILGDPMAGHFGLGEYEHVDFDELRNEFPQVTRGGAPSCGASEFPTQQHNTFEDHMEHNTLLLHNASSKELPGHSMFEGNNIQVNPDCNRKDIMCSGFEGNTTFNLSIPESEAQYHLQYTSPPPAMPDWKPIDGMSVPEMPDDISIRGKNIHIGDPFVNDDAGGTSEYGVMHTDPDLTNQLPGDDLENPGGCTEGIFADFEFTSDVLNLLLLDSPNDVNEDDRLPNVFETKESSATDVYIDIPSNTGPFEKNDVDSHMGGSNFQNSLETQMPTSTAYVNSEFPEYCNGVICCVLNTEDPEIPCNDHIVFPSKPRSASSSRRTQSEAYNLSLHGKDSTGTQSSAKGLSTMKREQKRFGESRQASQTRGLDVGHNRAVNEPGVKFETSRPETFNGPRSSSSGPGAPCQSSQGVKNEPLELPLSRQPGCSVAEKSSHLSDVGHIHTAIGGTSQDGQTSLALKNQESHTLGSADGMAAEPGIDSLLSDPEELFSESDTDIPYFSDVEAMILDMDLGPEDQDFFCSKEVAKYQHEDVKRAIIRLEQNAHSYMQRAISSHGAIAILYGRHSKHYIKKPEVLLGRATGDVMVDIDLGREGRANKISRRQAIIKMDKDGAFNIKNTGKCSIYVNSKEVFPGQSLGLHSNCLIEIRGMPFIFETSQTRVKQYLDNATRKLEDKKVNI